MAGLRRGRGEGGERRTAAPQRRRARRQGRRDRDRLRSARSLEWLESHAASDLPSRRQAGLAGGACRIRSRVQAQGPRSGRRRGRVISPSPRRLQDGARLGAEAASDLGFAASVPAMPPIGGGKVSISPRRCGGCVAARARPSSICRTTLPPRTSSLRASKVTARASMSSATPRSAWAPTRARPPMSWRSACCRS